VGYRFSEHSSQRLHLRPRVLHRSPRGRRRRRPFGGTVHSERCLAIYQRTRHFYICAARNLHAFNALGRTLHAYTQRLLHPRGASNDELNQPAISGLAPFLVVRSSLRAYSSKPFGGRAGPVGAPLRRPGFWSPRAPCIGTSSHKLARTALYQPSCVPRRRRATLCDRRAAAAYCGLTMPTTPPSRTRSGSRWHYPPPHPSQPIRRRHSARAIMAQ